MAEEGPWSESQWFPTHENIWRNWYKPNACYNEEENDRRWRIQNGTWAMNESIKEIDGERDAWLICNLILRRTEGPSPSADWYDEKDNSSYHITDAPFPPPKATYKGRSTNYFRDGHNEPLVELLDTRTWLLDNTTWAIGYGAVLKMDFIYNSHDLTSEHVTLNWMQGKLPPSRFKIPRVIHHEVQMKRSITFETQIHGLDLGQAWMFLSDVDKWRYITAVADFCSELSKIKGDKIGSVEGKGIYDLSLPVAWPEGVSAYSAENIHESWANTSLAPALSEFCFSHNFLTPDNIILVEEGRDNPIPTIGVVDWSCGGFVPKAWVRTRFAVDIECDLPIVHKLRKGKRTGIPEGDAHNYRWAVWKTLENMPYNMPEVKDLWWEARPEYAARMGRFFITGRCSLVPRRNDDPNADFDAL
ncbi:hypothetical protein OCU04_006160 [Sclerotinia nivalis]|uniref:Aminoglycoside phosphotransferase domain-containing protein n=1 Tax=Sclerotinia nivalis TaxID=352851 RepID=A0A9X0DJQ7_9HELO|nr:hypothetical protein OCU04_006160 [Sclerotinia nivalis]